MNDRDDEAEAIAEQFEHQIALPLLRNNTNENVTTFSTEIYDGIWKITIKRNEREITIPLQDLLKFIRTISI